MTLTELNKEHTKRYNKVFNDNQVFWAFGDKQWEEAKKKYNISKNNKVASIGGGGYVLSKNIAQLKKDLKELDEWYSEQEKLLDDKIRLKRISAERYEDMLCVLPPIYHSNGVFQVSEACDHVLLNGKEQARYDTFQEKDGRHYNLGLLTKQQAREYSTSIKAMNKKQISVLVNN